MSQTIQDLWSRLERHLAAHAPLALESLNPPATESQIRDAEAALNTSFPDALRESLRIHNGNRSETGLPPHSLTVVPNEYDENGIYLASFGDLLPVESIVRWTQTYRDWDRDSPMEFLEIVGPVRHSAPRNWLVIVEGGSGNVLALDLTPPSDEFIGQVLSVNHDPSILLVNSPSFYEWFTTLVERYESGRYFFDVHDDDLQATDRHDPDAPRPTDEGDFVKVLKFPSRE